LKNVRVPTLVINARNDPFLPAAALPGPGDVSAAVTLEQPEQGGHVGFVSGAFPGNLGWLTRRLLDFLSSGKGAT
jgi:predicted alpha/beta-fold hydrolase